MALEKWKCRLGKENLETCLAVRGRELGGGREDAGAASRVSTAQPLPGRALTQDARAFSV